MGQFDYVEPSPSAPQNGPEAVDREVFGTAHDKDDGEVERLDAHRVRRAAHTQTVAKPTRLNDTHPFTKSCVWHTISDAGATMSISRWRLHYRSTCVVKMSETTY